MNALGSWMGQLLNGSSGGPIVKPKDGDGKSGDGSSGGNGDGNDPNGKGKEGNNADPLDTIWAESKKAADGDGKNKDGKDGNNDNKGGGGNNQTDPQKAVSDFLASQGLGEVKLSDAEIAQLKSGEGFQEVVTSLNSRIQQGFIRAMSNASQLMDSKIEKAMEKMQADSRGFYQGEQLRNLLRERIPAAKDPVIGPVAETVTRQLLAKGATIEQALDGTKKFFERSAKAFGFGASNVNTNTRGSFGSSGGRSANGDNSQGDGDEGDMNWMDLLKG